MFSQTIDRANIQPPSSRMALSPGVLAALQRVHAALRKASPTMTCSSSLQVLAERLAEDGLLVTLRAGLGVGAESPDYLATLRHSFLICQEGSSGLCIIVDPSFREQFKVAGMPSTSAYSNAVANVPECFVGTIGTVNALVCLLTGTLLQESSALGIELPPWRSKQALLSKWLPRRFADSVYAPPSFVTLHPALRSSVHGTTLSTSPTSVQSWPSLARTHSDIACSNGSSAACGSATTTATTASSGDDRSSARRLSEPHTVITGFSTPATAAAPATALPSSPYTKCAAATAAAAGRSSPARSALTAQLVSASTLSRTVQTEAEAHWQRCLLNLRASADHHTATQRQAPVPTITDPTTVAATVARPAVAGAATASDPCGSVSTSCSSLKARAVESGLCGDLLHSLVVSPVPRRTGGSGGPASLKRGSGCSLKLSTATLKMLPRVYTVKLATAGCC